MKATCMKCKFYKVEDAQSGYCRAAGGKEADGAKDKPMVRHDHLCPQWADCGQNYYIRLGWIKAQEAKKTAATRQ